MPTQNLTSPDSDFGAFESRRRSLEQINSKEHLIAGNLNLSGSSFPVLNEKI